MANKKDAKKIRVRIAPSPTGALHIGTARSALFNYLYAKNPPGGGKGKFILRIEDTDLERSDLKWTQDILEGLKWLQIEWDEGPDIGGDFGPYKQTQRINIYKKHLEKLLSEGKAYHCFCGSEELEIKRQEQMSRGVAPKYDGTCAKLSQDIVEKSLKDGRASVIRFKVPTKKVKFKDLVRGEVEFDSKLIGDIVIAKNLETPLYNFAVVVDDFEMKISHVIRGEDHIANTPKQILMQEALGFETPTYGHLPLILAPDRSKMSKRFGAVAVNDYREQGYLPEAIVNFMALLGWNPGTEKEIFSLKQLEKEFSIEKVQKSGAVFNIQRLDFINGYYIREKSAKKLTELCRPYLKKAGLLIEGQITESGLEKIIEVSKARMKKLSDIVELADLFFVDELKYDAELLRWQKMTNEDVKDGLLLCDTILSNLKTWNIKKIEEVLLDGAGEFNKQKGYPEQNRGFFLWPLRVALSGKKASPSPFEIADILGKEKTLKRINEAISRLT
jgi:glutamyl-tRNA synthetase